MEVLEKVFKAEFEHPNCQYNGTGNRVLKLKRLYQIRDPFSFRNCHNVSDQVKGCRFQLNNLARGSENCNVATPSISS